MRFQRFSKPTEVTLVCGCKVVAISAVYVKHLWGWGGPEEFLVAGITEELKRVYFHC